MIIIFCTFCFWFLGVLIAMAYVLFWNMEVDSFGVKWKRIDEKYIFTSYAFFLLKHKWQ